jgi:hypothetical protein
MRISGCAQLGIVLNLVSCVMASSRWSSVPMAPPDPILGVGVAFKADASPEKVNLGIGAYRTSEGKPMVLKCVREAEKRICNDMTMDKEYLPMQVGHALRPMQCVASHLLPNGGRHHGWHRKPFLVLTRILPSMTAHLNDIMDVLLIRVINREKKNQKSYTGIPNAEIQERSHL